MNRIHRQKLTECFLLISPSEGDLPEALSSLPERGGSTDLGDVPILSFWGRGRLGDAVDDGRSCKTEGEYIKGHKEMEETYRLGW
jgi:hypothetical protein